MSNRKPVVESMSLSQTSRRRLYVTLFGAVFFLLVVTLCVSCAQKESKKRVHEMLIYVEENYAEKFGADVKIDDEKKGFVLNCSGPVTIESFDRIRVLINEFLSSHPEFFLNQGYSITVNVMGGNAGPVLAVISNRKVIRDEESPLYEELSSMWIVNYLESESKISQIEGSCTTLRAISLDSVMLDDLEALQGLPLLESVELLNGYTKEDVEEVQNALPNCKVN